MRVRDHIFISAATAAALRPLLGASALGLVAGGVLIDADHYVWFCLRKRCLRPVAAVHYFNQADIPQHAATRALHTPFALLAALILGIRRPRLLPVAVGMGLHIGLDACHEARMDLARARALERDRFSCRQCGVHTPNVGTHVREQPCVLPSYQARNLVSLCDACHELAHLGNAERVRWR
jgi:hypothetical protein